MIKVGIVGGGGYTGGELIRILLNHPECKIIFIQSRSQNGQDVSAVHTDLVGETDLLFTAELDENIDVLFLCQGHGESIKFLESNYVSDNTRIVDLSQDFRIKSPEGRTFIYGLPEYNHEKIKDAENIANPGCFATAIQLALLPIANKNLIQSDIHISAITGSTGAGQEHKSTTHFSWRTSNVSLYKPFQHQHLSEIKNTIGSIQSDWSSKIYFIPFRGNFSRGIFTSVYLECTLSIEDVKELYKEYYLSHPFVHISDANPDLKQVVNTNKCILFLEKHEDTLLIVSMIDNLLKGSVGQAVQNMNIMFGLDESIGLKLKSVAF